MGLSTVRCKRTGVCKHPRQRHPGHLNLVDLISASPAVDRGTSNSLTGVLSTDQRGAGFPRRVDKSVANAAGGDGTDIGASELQ